MERISDRHDPLCERPPEHMVAISCERHLFGVADGIEEWRSIRPEFPRRHLPGVEPLVPPLREILQPQAPEESRLFTLAFAAASDGQHADHRAGAVVALFECRRIETCSWPRQARPQRAIGKLAPLSATESRPSGERTPSASTTKSNGPARVPPAQTRIGRRSAPRSIPVTGRRVSIATFSARTASYSTLKRAARCTPSPNRLLPSR